MISFALPADQADRITVYGYSLAYLTLAASARLVDPAFWYPGPARRLISDLLAMLPGWTNVLALVALAGGPWANWLRLLALVTAASSLLFFGGVFGPRIGFFAWLLALVLMLFSRELAQLGRARC